MNKLVNLMKKSGPPYEVKQCPAMGNIAYLAPGSQSFACVGEGSLPEAHADNVRVICISDTHNEHRGLNLPAGDILLHAGDCLTESGTRYVIRKSGVIQHVEPEGVDLFRCFSRWLGSQSHRHKVLIAGNHDLVLQGLGRDRVQEILREETPCGHNAPIYLEHEDVDLGGFRIFGSPFAYYGGNNDAFFAKDCDFKDIPNGMHVIMTHMPAILPQERGKEEVVDAELVRALHRSGAMLHVCGHCHWAHGAYHSQIRGGQKIPSVVVSVCDSQWRGAEWKGRPNPPMASIDGTRGDAKDLQLGGYNVSQAIVVCDLRLPDGRPPLSHCTEASPTGRRPTLELSREVDVTKKALLFFGPPNDLDFVRKMLPAVSASFDVDFVDTTADGMRMVAERSYAVCVAKLGTEGNLSYPIIASLRELQGEEVFVAIHSATAARDAEIQNVLLNDLRVNSIIMPGLEGDAQLLQDILPFAGGT